MAPFSHGYYKIAAFETRINKSNARRPSKADEAIVSPYFPPNNTKKDVSSSLLEHEAQEYGYNINRKEIYKTMLENKVVSRQKKQIVIKKPCKQYPRLLSRNLMDKYAHLFGLVPVAAIKHDNNGCRNHNLESIRQSTTPSTDRRRISSSE